MKARQKRGRVLEWYELENNWAVVPVHYSHDPTKGPEWVAKMRKLYVRPDSWEREMEISFSTTSGALAYPRFKREYHVRTDIHYNDILPLCLCCDFNVNFMVWEVAQIINNKPHFIDEITMQPADIRAMVREFRSRYPFHRSEIWVYGDATGKARSAHDMMSAYEILQLEFKNYSSNVVLKVPAANPPVRWRLDTVNYKLMDENGEIGMFVSPKCKELIRDFEEVILDADGGIVQRRDPADPYSKRTHASDAVGYFLCWEWPMFSSSEVREHVRALRFRDYLGRLM